MSTELNQKQLPERGFGNNRPLTTIGYKFTNALQKSGFTEFLAGGTRCLTLCMKKTSFCTIFLIFNFCLFSVLISKLQELMDEWRNRHSYEVNVRGLRIRRRRRAVTVSGFLDQCCKSGCRLADLVSVGFC